VTYDEQPRSEAHVRNLPIRKDTQTLDAYRRTPDPDGRDFIVLASDDTRLVRHSTEREARAAAESLAIKNPGKKFRVFIATGEVTAAPFGKPNDTRYFVSPHDTLLVAVYTDADGNVARVIVGSRDGKAFTASAAWLADRLKLDLAPIGADRVTATPFFVPHLVGILSLFAREWRDAELLGKVA